MKKSTFIKLIASSLSLCVVLTACGKLGGDKDTTDYKSLATQFSNDLTNAHNEIEGLKLALASYDDKLKEASDFSRYTVLDTGVKSFRNFNDYIYLDGGIKFGSVDKISNTSKVYLTNNVSVAPSDKWTISIATANTDFSHENGIVGKMEVYKVYDSVASDFIYGNFVEPFLKENSLTPTWQQSLFIGGAKNGVEVNTKVGITTTEYSDAKRMIKNDAIYSTEELEAMQSAADESVAESEANRISEYLATMESTEPQTNESGETIPVSLPETVGSAPDVATGEVEVLLPQVADISEDYNLRIGVLLSGNTAIVYEFLYKDDDRAGANSELLDTLISSMSVDSQAVSRE